jgi:two-component system sensor histidine kinase HydH
VVQNIVEQHGGVIQVSSQPGKGTIFSLWLPIKATCKESQG